MELQSLHLGEDSVILKGSSCPQKVLCIVIIQMAPCISKPNGTAKPISQDNETPFSILSIFTISSYLSNRYIRIICKKTHMLLSTVQWQNLIYLSSSCINTLILKFFQAHKILAQWRNNYLGS